MRSAVSVSHLAIKDKRERRLEFRFDDGSDPSAWLLGVGSPRRAVFTRSQVAKVLEIAKVRFALTAEAVPAVDVAGDAQKECLL
jgi:hypothetical protein